MARSGFQIARSALQNARSGFAIARSGLATATSGLATAPSGLAIAPSGLASAPSGLATAPSALATATSGLATAPSALATAPSGLATAPSGLAIATWGWAPATPPRLRTPPASSRDLSRLRTRGPSHTRKATRPPRTPRFPTRSGSFRFAGAAALHFFSFPQRSVSQSAATSSKFALARVLETGNVVSSCQILGLAS